MRYRNYFLAIAFLPLLLLIGSCKKQLDARPNASLAIPQNTTDLQALLDYSPYMYSEPVSDEASADNYYITDASYNGLSMNTYRSVYTWEKDHQFDGVTSDWGLAYRKIYYCNTVLDALPNILGDAAELDNIRGQALFKRAKTFWHISDIWSLAYDSSTASTDLGIPLRLNSDFNEVSVRSSVQAGYDRILADLKTAVSLLPVIPLHPVRPSKPAAYAMLSRVYLSMRRYNDAKLYTDSALALKNTLIDYNTLDPNATYPFSNPNPETILASTGSNALISVSTMKIDSNLYNQYASNDLRKTLFFKSLGNNQYSFKGSYYNSAGQFSGLAVDELYLTRAECYARSGNSTEAMNQLNTLLIKRFKTGTFVALTATSAGDALAKILVERRKELLLRFTRWMDIKRLNREGAGISLRRYVLGKYYDLPANDLRFALALPEDVLAISGMPQNPR